MSKVGQIALDGYYRSGAMQDQKEKADIACKESEAQDHKVEKVMIWQRHPGKNSSPQPMVKGRDHIINEVLKNYKSLCRRWA